MVLLENPIEKLKPLAEGRLHVCEVIIRLINKRIEILWHGRIWTEGPSTLQQAALVLNASRRFRYTLDLRKEEDKEQRRRMIRAHAQVIRVRLFWCKCFLWCVWEILILTIHWNCIRQLCFSDWQENDRLVNKSPFAYLCIFFWRFYINKFDFAWGSTGISW